MVFFFSSCCLSIFVIFCGGGVGGLSGSV